MKYVIVIPDGCADEPQDQFGGKTPLQAASIPHMDQIASRGVVGFANHTPAHLPAGSAVANMSLLGYDPNRHFTGRAPLEAAAQGIELGEHDWAVRCNLVTITNQIMTSFTAGHISSNEATQLLKTAGEAIDDPNLEFFAGVSYRNLMLVRSGVGSSVPFSTETRTTPPHDLSDKSIQNDFPRGPGSQLLTELMNQSVDWFADHPVNHARVDAGNLPATNVWLWGLGRRPDLDSFHRIHGIQGAMITAVDLLRGLAMLIGWDCIEVPGATGYTDTDYAAKGRYAIEALANYDIVCVHVEAPDEASHEGDEVRKAEALENIDSEIVGPLLKHLQDQHATWRILITPDHPTFVRTKTHTHGNVPFAICGQGVTADQATTYDEISAQKSGLTFANGYELMPKFISADQFST